MLVFDAKLIFGTSNFVVFYVSIKHLTCFLQREPVRSGPEAVAPGSTSDGQVSIDA